MSKYHARIRSTDRRGQPPRPLLLTIGSTALEAGDLRALAVNQGLARALRDGRGNRRLVASPATFQHLRRLLTRPSSLIFFHSCAFPGTQAFSPANPMQTAFEGDISFEFDAGR
jgi:hypothetical protein